MLRWPASPDPSGVEARLWRESFKPEILSCFVFVFLLRKPVPLLENWVGAPHRKWPSLNKRESLRSIPVFVFRGGVIWKTRAGKLISAPARLTGEARKE